MNKLIYLNIMSKNICIKPNIKNVDGKNEVDKQIYSIKILILGGLLLVIFLWFNKIQILIIIFYESLLRSSNDTFTKRDLYIEIIKQVTFSFIIITIFYN